jgi:hypothetical protein
MKPLLKHTMGVIGGVVGVLLSLWGTGSIYAALTTGYVSWMQGALGVICLVVAVTIFRACFR